MPPSSWYGSLAGTLMTEQPGLVSADSKGIEALREMQAREIELHGISPFIQLLLADDPAVDSKFEEP